MAGYVPGANTNNGRAVEAWRHINHRLSVEMTRYLKHSDYIALKVRRSPLLKTRGR